MPTYRITVTYGIRHFTCVLMSQVANAVYSTMLQSMVSEWRSLLRQPSLPFGTVLLAPWKGRDISSFPLLRIAQTNLSTSGVANTFIVNTLDQVGGTRLRDDLSVS